MSNCLSSGYHLYLFTSLLLLISPSSDIACINFFSPVPLSNVLCYVLLQVIVQDAYRKDSSVIIQWDSEVSNILGFRVVYRLFGDKTFKAREIDSLIQEYISL